METILLVDDEAEVLAKAREMLEGTGFRIQSPDLPRDPKAPRVLPTLYWRIFAGAGGLQTVHPKRSET